MDAVGVKDDVDGNSWGHRFKDLSAAQSERKLCSEHSTTILIRWTVFTYALWLYSVPPKGQREDFLGPLLAAHWGQRSLYLRRISRHPTLSGRPARFSASSR
jgi:hypothetical protein